MTVNTDSGSSRGQMATQNPPPHYSGIMEGEGGTYFLDELSTISLLI